MSGPLYTVAICAVIPAKDFLFLCGELSASACVSALDVRFNLHSSYIIEAGRAASCVAQLSHDILLSNSRHTLVSPGHSSSSMGLTVANLWTVISLSLNHHLFRH